MSQELDWELSEIFDGGMFAFPVYEVSVARRVVSYLLRRGVLAEEVTSAIEQPGSTSDVVAWLSGDERKTMIGVWAMAWLNDARRRHQRSVPPQAADSPPPPLADYRQASFDSDFGGSADSRAGSRKGSIGDGLSTDFSDQLTTDDDDALSESDRCRKRRRCRKSCTDVDISVMTSRPVRMRVDKGAWLSRPRSAVMDDACSEESLLVDGKSDSGNVSDLCAGLSDRKSSCVDVTCRCTLPASPCSSSSSRPLSSSPAPADCARLAADLISHIVRV